MVSKILAETKFQIYNTKNGITFYLAKINEPKGIIDSNISKMCMPVKCVNTDLPLMPPFHSIVSGNEPLEASTASSSPGGNKSAAVNTIIRDEEFFLYCLSR